MALGLVLPVATESGILQTVCGRRRRMKQRFVLILALLLAVAAMQVIGAQQAGPAPGESLSQSYRGSQRDNVAYQKVPPIKVFDNLYYVGPGEVSVWLIPTTDGLIVIDSEIGRASWRERVQTAVVGTVSAKKRSAHR